MKKKHYHNFPLIEETRTDGWCYGVITEFIEEGGCSDGDGFVEAPDGSRAGLVWDVDPAPKEVLVEISPPENKNHWGLYQIFFPKRVFTMEDMVENFRAVLPQIQEVFGKATWQK